MTVKEEITENDIIFTIILLILVFSVVKFMFYELKDSPVGYEFCMMGHHRLSQECDMHPKDADETKIFREYKKQKKLEWRKGLSTLK